MLRRYQFRHAQFALRDLRVRLRRDLRLRFEEVEMTVMEDIARVIRLGGCVVRGMGVAPEKYRQLLEDATNQHDVVIGAKDSPDASFIASKMSGELLEPQSLSVFGLEINVYFVKTEKVTS